MTQPVLSENVKGRGRHYRDPVTDELVPSVTNVIGILDKPALPRWAARVVAEQAASMKSSLPNLADEEIVDMLKGAPWRSSGRAADRGTSVHGYLEARLLGIDPPELTGQASTYQAQAEAWLAVWQPEPIATELTVFGDGYAGTADLLCSINGKVTMVDFKTSSAVYPEAALQLAALSSASVGAFPDGVRAMPDIAEAAVVRIGTKDHETRWVADIESQFAAFQACLAVWHWRNDTPYLGDAR